MISPAQRFRACALAAAAIALAAPGLVAGERPETGPEATEYELLKARLGNDLNTLRDIASQERKIEAKRLMIENYDAHIDGVLFASLESGKAVQDEVFVTLMIWQFDLGNWSRGLDMAEHVLQYGLALPERFKRTPATMVTEEIAKTAVDVIKLDKDFPVEVLLRTEKLTEGHDVNDIVRAHLQKALGLQYARKANSDETAPDGPAGARRAALSEAYARLQRAHELFNKIGVTKDLERLKSALNKEPSADTV